MLAAVIEGTPPLLANQRARSGWATHKGVEDELRDLAWGDARRRRGRRPRIPAPVIVTLVVTPPARDARGHRRNPDAYPDLDGYQPTLKRMLDGVVLAGVILDDRPTIVTEIRTRQTPPGDTWRLELHIDPADTEAAA